MLSIFIHKTNSLLTDLTPSNPIQISDLFTRYANEERDCIRTSRYSPKYLFAVLPGQELFAPYFQRHQSSVVAVKSNTLDGCKNALKLELSHHVANHDKTASMGPFILLESELIDAFARAKALNATLPEENWSIVAVAVDRLSQTPEKKALVSYNYLLGVLDLPQREVCESKVLAWRVINVDAIAFTWGWNHIVNSDIGQLWFPALCARMETNCPREISRAWRDTPGSFENEGLSITTVMTYLEKTFGFRLGTNVAREMTRTLVHWSRRELMPSNGNRSISWYIENDDFSQAMDRAMDQVCPSPLISAIVDVELELEESSKTTAQGRSNPKGSIRLESQNGGDSQAPNASLPDVRHSITSIEELKQYLEQEFGALPNILAGQLDVGEQENEHDENQNHQVALPPRRESWEPEYLLSSAGTEGEITPLLIAKDVSGGVTARTSIAHRGRPVKSKLHRQAGDHTPGRMESAVQQVSRMQKDARAEPQPTEQLEPEVVATVKTWPIQPWTPEAEEVVASTEVQSIEPCPPEVDAVQGNNTSDVRTSNRRSMPWLPGSWIPKDMDNEPMSVLDAPVAVSGTGSEQSNPGSVESTETRQMRIEVRRAHGSVRQKMATVEYLRSQEFPV